MARVDREARDWLSWWRMARQMELFPPSSGRSPAVAEGEPLLLDEIAQTVAGQIPERIRLGTSSWSFPGWRGLIWRSERSTAALARDGLREYTRSPLLRTVGLDRTFHAPMAMEGYRALAEQTPEEFRFVVKAPEALTVARWYRAERFGALAGRRNELFLDAARARELVVDPASAGLGTRLGVVLFQLPPQDTREVGGPARFASRLHAFLRALPTDVPYAVELRNRELFTAEYVAAVVDAGATHCLNAHPAMPAPALQDALLTASLLGRDRGTSATGSGGPLVIRWMLAPHFRYEEARDRYSPFDRLVDEDPAMRREISRLSLGAVAQGRPVFVIVNNKAEGSSPLSVRKLATEIAATVRRHPEILQETSPSTSGAR